jgi:hypothetical protein
VAAITSDGFFKPQMVLFHQIQPFSLDSLTQCNRTSHEISIGWFHYSRGFMFAVDKSRQSDIGLITIPATGPDPGKKRAS